MKIQNLIFLITLIQINAAFEHKKNDFDNFILS